MSKLEKVKTIIDLLKNILLALLVGLFGMISYLFLNTDAMSAIKIAIVIFAISVDIIIIAITVTAIIKKINELEDL